MFDPKQSKGLVILAANSANFCGQQRSIVYYTLYLYASKPILLVNIDAKMHWKTFLPQWYFALKCLDFAHKNSQNNGKCDRTLNLILTAVETDVFDPIGTNWTQNNIFRYFKKSQLIASEQCKHDI